AALLYVISFLLFLRGFLVLRDRFVLVVLVLAKTVFVQLVAALGVGLGLSKLEEVKGRTAADQGHHKEHYKAAHAGAFRFFLLRLGFLRLLRLRLWAGTLGHIGFTYRAIRVDCSRLALGRTGASFRGGFAVLQQ